MKNQITSRDYELLSAYLDNQLASHERERLESRLNLEPQLKQELHELGKTRSLLRTLPRLRAPRNYFVDVEAVVKPHAIHPILRLAPVYGIASAIATILLVLVIFGDRLLSSTSPVALAPASVAPTVIVEVVQEVELSTAPTSAPAEAAPMMMEAPELAAPAPSANLKIGESGLATPTTIYLDAMLPTSTPEIMMSILEAITTTDTLSCEEYYISGGSQKFPFSSYCLTPTSSPSNFLEGIQATATAVFSTSETPLPSSPVTPSQTPSPTPTQTPVPADVSASIREVAPEAAIEVPLMPAPSEQDFGAAYPAPSQLKQIEEPGTSQNFAFIQYLVLAIELSLAAIAITAGIIAIILRIRAGR